MSVQWRNRLHHIGLLVNPSGLIACAFDRNAWRMDLQQPVYC